jgi:molybdopterin-containing oxidoreductase family iron-sulfur binding subunit
MEQKKYWKGLEELHNTKEHQETVNNEFKEDLPFEESEGLLNATTPRRDFLKYLGCYYSCQLRNSYQKSYTLCK